jgi:hypothetical protein
VKSSPLTARPTSSSPESPSAPAEPELVSRAQHAAPRAAEIELKLASQSLDLASEHHHLVAQQDNVDGEVRVAAKS